MATDRNTERTAWVLRVSGRTLQLYDGTTFEASSASRSLKPIVGDCVGIDASNKTALVRSINPRRNCLTRTFGTLDKEIVANLDRLFLVSAQGALFNTAVIDRVLSIAWREDIPVTLILNKSDLGAEGLFQIYSELMADALQISAKFGDNFANLEEALCDPALNFVALCGVSGAGKSTILNRLVPDAARRTQEVSTRTGQGKQTTSESIAYVYEREGQTPLLIADLPGVQYFGVSHLTKSDVTLSFPEFSRYREKCQYCDCLHMAEPDCAVKAAVNIGELAPSRYESYVSMITELQDLPASRKYRKKDAAGRPRPLQTAYKTVKDSRE